MSNPIELCKQCRHKSFSSSQGIVCGLTSEKPTFTDYCPTFEKDASFRKQTTAPEKVSNHQSVPEKADKPISPWRTFFSVLIFLLVLVRLIVRCNNQ